MAKKEISEYKEMVKRIKEANEAYYNSPEPILSDKEYDELYDKLVAYEELNGKMKDSPTGMIGAGVKTGNFPKVKHEYPYMSLSKTKLMMELSEWLGLTKGVLSWKYDGISLMLYYDKGKLKKAVTRGDGLIGEDVTENVKKIKDIPVTIDDKRFIVIRGEAVVGFRQFDSVNQTFELKHRYKHPRNMVFGAVKTIDSEKCEEFGVEFKAHELVNALDLGIRSFEIGLTFIETLGIPTANFSIVYEHTLFESVKLREEIVKSINYPTDGLVLVKDDISTHYTGGSSKYPNHAKAFKWLDELFETRVIGLDWKISPRGILSPVVLVEPVDILGSTVKRVNMHNLSILKEKEIGIGDRVLVYKSNMIIPCIDRNLDKTGNIKVPDICPGCGSPTEIVNGVKGNVQFLRCMDFNCGGKNRENK